MTDSSNVEPIVRAHLSVVDMALKSGDTHAAYRNLNEAMDAAESDSAALSQPDLVLLSRMAGKVYRALGEYDRAEEAFESALEIESDRGDLCSPEACRDARHLAECFRLRRKYGQAEALYKRCISQLSKRGSQLLLAKCSLGLGQVYLDEGKLDQAEQSLKATLDLFEQTVGRRSFWYGRALMTYARLFYLRRQMEQSEALLNEALTIIEPQIGPYHPLRETMLRRLGKVKSLEGNQASAEECFAAAEEIEKHLRQIDV